MAQLFIVFCVHFSRDFSKFIFAGVFVVRAYPDAHTHSKSVIDPRKTPIYALRD